MSYSYPEYDATSPTPEVHHYPGFSNEIPPDNYGLSEAPQSPSKFVAREYGSKYSDSEDEANDVQCVKLRKELSLFEDELQKDAGQAGCLFLIFWCSRQLLQRCGACGGAQKQEAMTRADSMRNVIGGVDGSGAKASSRRMLSILVWMLTIVGSQIVLYVALGWAVVRGAVLQYRPANALLFLPVRTLCPGQDDMSPAEPSPSFSVDDWRANSPQILCYAALAVLMLGLTALDWMKTHHMYRTYLRAVAPGDWLRSKGIQPSAERPFTLLQQKYRWVIFLDFFLHVLMTIVIFNVSIFAVFYITTVGKMLAILFALQFMETVDDVAKDIILSTTPLAKWMYTIERQKNAQRIRGRSGCTWFYTVGMWMYHLLYLTVYAMILWSLVFLGMGCKPGKSNSLDFF